MTFRINKLLLSALIISLLALPLSGCSKNKNASLINQAMDAIATGDYESALSLLEESLEAGDSPQLVKRGQGIAYMGLSRYDDAIEALEDSLRQGSWQVGPLERDTNYYLAAAFEKNGSHEEAIEVYDAITAMWPKELPAYTLRGYVYLNNNDYDRAIEDFNTVLEAAPSDYDTLIDIYKALEQAGYSAAGEEYIQKALGSDNKDMTGYDRGRMYYHLKQYDEARNALEAVRDSGSGAILYLGLSYEALGDYNYATSVYQSYISSKPGDGAILNQLGMCEMKMGSYQDAYNHFTQGLETEDPSYRQSLLYNQICASEYLGDFDKAKSLMSQYLQQYPEDEAAIRENIFLKTR